MPTYKRAPVEFVRGEGARLWDSEGKEYLDFLGGISVCSVGHCHPAVVEAVREQAGMLTHASNLYLTAAGRRARRAPLRVEPRRQGVPLQLRRRGERVRDQARPQARSRPRHRRARDRRAGGRLPRAHDGRRLGDAGDGGRTRASLPTCRASCRCPRDDPDALRDAVGERTAAVMLEPIQGETGVLPISDEMLAAAREACDAAGALLVFDEIQTGMGRTGSLWAYEQLPVAAGRDDHGQGARRRAAGRRLRRRARARRHPPARRPRLDLRRRPAGRGGGARRLRRDRRSRPAARRARAGRRAARGARSRRRRGLDAGPRPDDRGRRSRTGSTPPRSPSRRSRRA